MGGGYRLRLFAYRKFDPFISLNLFIGLNNRRFHISARNSKNSGPFAAAVKVFHVIKSAKDQLQ